MTQSVCRSPTGARQSPFADEGSRCEPPLFVPVVDVIGMTAFLANPTCLYVPFYMSSVRRDSSPQLYLNLATQDDCGRRCFESGVEREESVFHILKLERGSLGYVQE